MIDRTPSPSPGADGPQEQGHADRRVVFAGACALALAMGIGRFVYTPILPMMREQAQLSAAAASTLATGNYLGYLLGALAGMIAHPLARHTWSLRGNAVVLIATLALMPVTSDPLLWSALRTIAGFASALIFLVASNTVLEHLGKIHAHLAGWAYGGVGAGICLSGLMSLGLRRVGSWTTAWLVAAALCAALLPWAWSLGVRRPAAAAVPRSGDTARPHPMVFGSLMVSYALEGAG